MGCVNGAWRVFCTFFCCAGMDSAHYSRYRQKTVTVPWNYAAKLEEINRIIKDGGRAKQYSFKTCPEASWKACMDDTDKHLKVADKPSHKGKQWAHQELHQRESLKCSGYIGNQRFLRYLCRCGEGNRAQPVLRVKVCSNEGRSRKHPYRG